MGVPPESSVYKWIFPNKNHPAMGVPPLMEPPHIIMDHHSLDVFSCALGVKTTKIEIPRCCCPPSTEVFIKASEVVKPAAPTPPG